MATVPRAWIDGYADSLEMVSDEMRGRLADALGQVDYTMPVAYVRERLIAIMQAHVYESRAMASQLAAEFYDGLRERQVGERMGAVAYDGYDPVRVERRVRSAVKPLAKVQDEFRWADDVAHDEEYQQEMTRVAARKLCRDLADYQGYSIKQAAGSTVFRNGGRDGRRVKFARIPRGSKSYPNGCPFCQMLASRGFVYRSKLTAGGIDPDHYHSDCQCMVVPGWDGASVEGYDPRDYDEGYQEYLDQDHSKHEAHVAETQRNRYDVEGHLKSGDGNRVDEKGALTNEDRALIRSKRTAAGNETRKADRNRMFFNLGVTENEWKAMSEAEQAALLSSKSKEVAFREYDERRRTYAAYLEDVERTIARLHIIDSKSYRRKVIAMSDEGFGDMLVEDMRRALHHRSGTRGEDLYAYDATLSKRISSVTNSRLNSAVYPSKKMSDGIKKAVSEGHSVVIMHNHPGSSIPSVSDILSVKRSGAAYGVIACHDGSIYRFSIVGEPVAGYNLSQSTWQRTYARRLDRGEPFALKELEGLFGVRVEHIA